MYGTRDAARATSLTATDHIASCERLNRSGRKRALEKRKKAAAMIRNGSQLKVLAPARVTGRQRPATSRLTRRKGDGCSKQTIF